jgi:hypothetical protein
MEDLSHQIKNQRTIKTIAWNIIVIAFFGLVLGISGIIIYLRSHTDFQAIPENTLAHFFNPRLYLYQSIAQLVLNILLMWSSFHVLGYSEKWRKILIYGSIAAILFLIILPIININSIPNVDTNLETWGDAKTTIVTWSFIVSYCVASFFVWVIVKLSSENVKPLFIKTR